VADLNNGLIFLENNSIDEIQAFHFLEHVVDLEFFMSEIYRVLKKDGKLIAICTILDEKVPMQNGHASSGAPSDV